MKICGPHWTASAPSTKAHGGGGRLTASSSFHRRRLWNAAGQAAGWAGSRSARQAVGVQAAALRGARDASYAHAKRRPEPDPTYPLCHHPRRRHPAALRRRPPVPRHPGPPAEPAALRPRRGPRRRRLRRVAAARQPDAGRRPQVALRPHLRRLGRHRPLHRRPLRRLPGPVRRRHLHRQGRLRGGTPSRPPSAGPSRKTTSSATTSSRAITPVAGWLYPTLKCSTNLGVVPVLRPPRTPLGRAATGRSCRGCCRACPPHPPAPLPKGRGAKGKPPPLGGEGQG